MKSESGGERVDASSKVISMSLYGSAPLYSRGAIENARLAPRVYPGWRLCVFTDGESGAEETLRTLGADVTMMPRPTGIFGMSWRFLPASWPVECLIVRDADSRLNVRERAAVDAWLASGRRGHVMRDHREHSCYSMLGGLWGVRGGVIPDMPQRIASWGRWARKFDDTDFLDAHVWPAIRADACQHSSYPSPWGGEPFPSHPPFSGFVGAVVEPAGMLVLGHLGLGDALILNGALRALAAGEEARGRLRFLAKHQNLASVRYMLRDVPSVDVQAVRHEQEAAVVASMHADRGGSVLRLGHFATEPLDLSRWDEQMYGQAGVDYAKRWDDFFVKRDPSRELPAPAFEFILVHDDATRGFVIERAQLPRDVPVVRVSPDRSACLFDWWAHVERATEIHVIDSCVAAWVDSVPTRARRLVLHDYARRGLPPRRRKDWVRI